MFCCGSWPGSKTLCPFMAILAWLQSRRRFVEGQAVTEGLLLAPVPSLPGLAFLFPPFFSASFVSMFFVLFYQEFKNQNRHSFSQAYELFGQVNYAAGHTQATQRDGQEGQTSLFRFQRRYHDAQPGNAGCQRDYQSKSYNINRNPDRSYCNSLQGIFPSRPVCGTPSITQ